MLVRGRVEAALEEVARVADQVVVARALVIGNGALGLLLVKVCAYGGGIVGPHVRCGLPELLPLLNLNFLFLIEESWIRRGAGAVDGSGKSLGLARFALSEVKRVCPVNHMIKTCLSYELTGRTQSNLVYFLLLTCSDAVACWQGQWQHLNLLGIARREQGPDHVAL